MIKYGLTFADNTDPLSIEFTAIRKGGLWEDSEGFVQGLGLFAHYKNAMTLMWPHHDWHRWADLILRRIVENDVSVFMGSGDCVSGDTRLLNPLTGKSTPIQELCELKRRPVIMTLDGPELAGVPFLKGEDWLYEVTCSNGSRFKATAHHLVLTNSGFEYVSDLRIG